MENKADYAELRRLYFGHREIDSTPSHSKVSNYETGIDQTIDGFSSDLHNFLTIHEHSSDEEPMTECDVLETNASITQRSTELISNLCDKYGNRTYNKITSMINNEDFSEWEKLEKELFASELSLNLSQIEEEEADSLTYDKIVSELSELTADPMDDDLDYLDALVQHDYSRLRKFQSDEECLSSIFSEILENEQNSNMNYQDEIFNKNIDLIFNSNIDLDGEGWIDSPQTTSVINNNLEEAIEQIKQTVQSNDSMLSSSTSELKQADLNAFYSENKSELPITAVSDEQQKETEYEANYASKNTLNKGLKIYISLTFIILLIILMLIIFK